MSNPKEMRNKKSHNLPPIPGKIYFAIGEVARLCSIKPHVLRYWEQEFKQLTPNKRRGNRRYYQYKDILMVRKIRSLLYDEGYTIDGARQQLNMNAATCVGEKNYYALLQAAITSLEKVAHSLQ